MEKEKKKTQRQIQEELTALADGYESIDYIRNHYNVDKIREKIKELYNLSGTDDEVERFYNQEVVYGGQARADNFRNYFLLSEDEYKNKWRQLRNEMLKEREALQLSVPGGPWNPGTTAVKVAGEFVTTGIQSIANMFRDDDKQVEEQSDAINKEQTVRRAMKLGVDEINKRIKALDWFSGFLDGAASGVIPDDFFQDRKQTAEQLAEYITPYRIEDDPNGWGTIKVKNPKYDRRIASMFQEGLYRLDQTSLEALMSELGDLTGLVASIGALNKVKAIPSAARLIDKVAEYTKNPQSAIRLINSIAKLRKAGEIEKADELLAGASKLTKAGEFLSDALVHGVDDAVTFSAMHLASTSSKRVDKVAESGFLLGTTGVATGRTLKPVADIVKKVNYLGKPLSVGMHSVAGGASFATGSASIAAVNGKSEDEILETAKHEFLKGLVFSFFKATGSEAWKRGLDYSADRTIKRAFAGDNLNNIDKTVSKLANTDFIIEAITSKDKEVSKAVKENLKSFIEIKDEKVRSERKKYVENLQKRTLEESMNKILHPDATPESSMYDKDLADFLTTSTEKMPEELSKLYDKYEGNEAIEEDLAIITSELRGAAEQIAKNVKANEESDIDAILGSLDLPETFKQKGNAKQFLTRYEQELADRILENGLNEPQEPVADENIPSEGNNTPENKKPSEGQPGPLKKVISGFQTGGDIGAIKGAKGKGLETGGTMPEGFKIEGGKKPEYAEEYGAVEGEPDPSTYVKRTMKNVDDADGTVAIMWGKSVGTDKTIGYAQTGKWQRGDGKSKNDGHRPVLVIDHKDVDKAAQQLADFVIENNIQTLNAAGHRESTQPGIEKFSQQVIEKAYDILAGGNKGLSSDEQQLADMMGFGDQEPPKEQPTQQNDDAALAALMGFGDPLTPKETSTEDKEFKNAAKRGLYKVVDGKLVLDGDKVDELIASESDKARAGFLLLSELKGERADLLYNMYKETIEEERKNLPDDILSEASALYKEMSGKMSYTLDKLSRNALASGNKKAITGAYLAMKAFAVNERYMGAEQAWINTLKDMEATESIMFAETPGFVEIKKSLDDAFGFEAPKHFSEMFTKASEGVSRKGFLDSINSNEVLAKAFDGQEDLLTRFYNFVKTTREDSKYLQRKVASFNNGEIVLKNLSDVDPDKRSQKSSFLSEQLPGSIISITIGDPEIKVGNSTGIHELSRSEQAEFFAKMWTQHGYMPLMSHGAKNKIYFTKLAPELVELKDDKDRLDKVFEEEFKDEAKAMKEIFAENSTGSFADQFGDKFDEFQKLFALNQRILGEKIFGRGFEDRLKNVVTFNKRGQIPGSMGDFVQRNDFFERDYEPPTEISYDMGTEEAHAYGLTHLKTEEAQNAMKDRIRELYQQYKEADPDNRSKIIFEMQMSNEALSAAIGKHVNFNGSEFVYNEQVDELKKQIDLVRSKLEYKDTSIRTIHNLSKEKIASIFGIKNGKELEAGFDGGIIVDQKLFDKLRTLYGVSNATVMKIFHHDVSNGAAHGTKALWARATDEEQKILEENGIEVLSSSLNSKYSDGSEVNKLDLTTLRFQGSDHVVDINNDMVPLPSQFTNFIWNSGDTKAAFDDLMQVVDRSKNKYVTLLKEAMANPDKHAKLLSKVFGVSNKLNENVDSNEVEEYEVTAKNKTEEFINAFGANEFITHMGMTKDYAYQAISRYLFNKIARPEVPGTVAILRGSTVNADKIGENNILLGSSYKDRNVWYKGKKITLAKAVELWQNPKNRNKKLQDALTLTVIRTPQENISGARRVFVQGFIGDNTGTTVSLGSKQLKALSGADVDGDKVTLIFSNSFGKNLKEALDRYQDHSPSDPDEIIKSQVQPKKLTRREGMYDIEAMMTSIVGNINANSMIGKIVGSAKFLNLLKAHNDIIDFQAEKTPDTSVLSGKVPVTNQKIFITGDTDGRNSLVSNKRHTIDYFKNLLKTQTKDGGSIVNKEVTFLVTPTVGTGEAFLEAFAEAKAEMPDFNAKLELVIPKSYQAGYAGREIYTRTEANDKLFYRISPKKQTVDAYIDLLKSVNGENSDVTVTNGFDNMIDNMAAEANESWNLSFARHDGMVNLVDHTMDKYNRRSGGDVVTMPDRETMDDVLKLFIRSATDAGKYGGMPPWEDVEASMYSMMFNGGQFSSHLEGKMFRRIVDEVGQQKELRAALRAITSGTGYKEVVTSEGPVKKRVSLTADEIHSLVKNATDKRGEPATGLESILYDLPKVELDIINKVDTKKYIENATRTLSKKAIKKVEGNLNFLKKYGADRADYLDKAVEDISLDKGSVLELASKVSDELIKEKLISIGMEWTDSSPARAIKPVRDGLNFLRNQTNDLVMNDVYKVASIEVWKDLNNRFKERYKDSNGSGLSISQLSTRGVHGKIEGFEKNQEVLEAINRINSIEEHSERLIEEFNKASEAARKNGGVFNTKALERIKKEILLYAPEDKLFEDYYFFKFFDVIRGSLATVGDKRSAVSRIGEIMPFIPKHIAKQIGDKGQELLNSIKKPEFTAEYKATDQDKAFGTLNAGIDPIAFAKGLKLYISKEGKANNFNNAVVKFFQEYDKLPVFARWRPSWGEDNPYNVFHRVTGIDYGVDITPEFISNGMTRLQKQAFYDYIYAIGKGLKVNDRLSGSFSNIWNKYYSTKLPKTILEKYPAGFELVDNLEYHTERVEVFKAKISNVVANVDKDLETYVEDTGMSRGEADLKLALAMHTEEGYRSADPRIRAIADKVRYSAEFDGNALEHDHQMLSDTRALTTRNLMRLLDYKLKNFSKYDMARFVGMSLKDFEALSPNEKYERIAEARELIRNSTLKDVGKFDYYYPLKYGGDELGEYAMINAATKQLMESGSISAKEYAASLALTYESGAAKERKAQTEGFDFDPDPVNDLLKHFEMTANAYQHNTMLDAFLNYQDAVAEIVKSGKVSKDDMDAINWINDYVKGVALHSFGHSRKDNALTNSFDILSSLGFTVIAANPVSSAHNFSQRFTASFVAGSKYAKEARAWGRGKGQLSINGHNIANWQDVSKQIGVSMGTQTDRYTSSAFEDLTSDAMKDMTLLADNKLYEAQKEMAFEDFKEGKIDKATLNDVSEYLNKKIEANLKEFNKTSYTKKAAKFVSDQVNAMSEGRLAKAKGILGAKIPVIEKLAFKSIEVGNRLFAGKIGYYKAYKLKAAELERNRGIFEEEAMGLKQERPEYADKDIEVIIAELMHERAHKAGLAGARKLISYTQFDYHGWNTPAWLRSPAQKFFFQFKSFLAHQMNLFEKERQNVVKQHQVGLYEDAYMRAAKLLSVSGALTLMTELGVVGGASAFTPIPLAEEISQLAKLLLGDEDAFYGKGALGIPLYVSGVMTSTLIDAATNIYLLNAKNDKAAGRRLAKKFGFLGQIDALWDKNKDIDYRYIAPELGYRWMASVNRTAYSIINPLVSGKTSKVLPSFLITGSKEFGGVSIPFSKYKRKRNY